MQQHQVVVQHCLLAAELARAVVQIAQALVPPRPWLGLVVAQQGGHELERVDEVRSKPQVDHPLRRHLDELW